MTRKKRQDSVFKEAWDNMRSDFSGLLPDALADKLGKEKRGWKVVVVVTLAELLLLGVVGKFLYDWLVG